MHLIMYASKDMPVEAAEAWCNARAVDCIRAPTAEEQGYLDRYAEAFRHAHRYEEGAHIRPPSNDFVWNAIVVGPEDVARAAGNAGLEAFLREHLGWVAWGDNDGV